MKVTNPQTLYASSACFATSLAGVGFAYTNTLGAVVLGIVTFLASLFTHILAWQNRGEIEKLHKYAESMAMAGIVFFLPSIFSMGLLPGLLVLLSFAQLALNLQLQEHKHVHYGLVVSFVILFMGAAEAITGYYLIFMAAYAATAALCLSFLNSDQQTSDRIPFHPVATIKLSGWLLGLSLILYLVLPRPPAANLGGQYSMAAKFYKASEWQDNSGNGERDSAAKLDTSQDESASIHDSETYKYRGFEQSFSISNTGQHQGGGNALLALMSAPYGAYLKVETFDKFDGTRWHRHTDDYQQRRLKNLSVVLEPDMEPNYQQTITLVNKLGSYIPAAPVAVKLHFPAEVIAQDAYQNLKLPSALEKDIVYTVESFVSYYEQRPFSGFAVPPNNKDLGLYNDFNRRIAKLAEEITQGTSDDMSKALMLESYLKNNYQYDLNSVFTSQQNTPLDSFLFETKSGHCEYFASALAVMLRSQGIPSRLITGFSATTMNPLTGYYEIYSLDGHAWVEAWIEGKGWMLLEATPPYHLPQQTSSTMTADQIQSYVDQLKQYARLGSNDTPSLAQIWSYIAEQVRALMQYTQKLIQAYIVVITLILVFIASSWLLFRHFKNDILAWKLYWDVKRYQHGNTPNDAVFYMKHIHRLLKLRNQPRLPGDSIESLCKHAALHGLDHARLESFAKQINLCFYENKQCSVNDDHFKSIFFYIFSRT